MRKVNELSDLEMIKHIIKGYVKDFLTECYWYDFHHDESTQVIKVNIRKEEEGQAFIFLRLGLSSQNREIYIYNIWLPKEDRGQNWGLGTINIIYQISKLMNYA